MCIRQELSQDATWRIKLLSPFVLHNQFVFRITATQKSLARLKKNRLNAENELKFGLFAFICYESEHTTVATSAVTTFIATMSVTIVVHSTEISQFVIFWRKCKWKIPITYGSTQYFFNIKDFVVNKSDEEKYKPYRKKWSSRTCSLCPRPNDQKRCPLMHATLDPLH